MTQPTLGYESKGAAAVGLREKGMKWREIAEALGLPDERAASSLACKTLKRAEMAKRLIPISAKSYYEFEREAKRRKLKPKEFIARILNVIAEDKLFNAIIEHDA